MGGSRTVDRGSDQLNAHPSEMNNPVKPCYHDATVFQSEIHRAHAVMTGRIADAPGFDVQVEVHRTFSRCALTTLILFSDVTTTFVRLDEKHGLTYLQAGKGLGPPSSPLGSEFNMDSCARHPQKHARSACALSRQGENGMLVTATATMG